MATGPDPFVGRSAERALIRQRVEAAAGGSGGLVLLAGPAGIGKSRLVEESLAGAALDVRWGRCLDEAGAPPLWPWSRAAGDLLPPTGPHGPGSEPDRAAGDPVSARFRMLVAATDALIAAAAPDGLVIVLEDLHWADDTSLRLLGHVAGELRRSHLLVLGTHRPPLRGSRLDAAMPDLLRAAGGEALSLPPLAAAEVAQLLGATTGIDVGTPAAEATTARTGGNPLLVRAVARSLPADPDAARHWLLTDAQPADLRHLLASVLAGLPATVLDVVTAAAVLGDEPDLAVLEALAPDGASVHARLDDATSAGLLTGDARQGYRFRHALLRDGVLAGLDPTVRRALHARAAQALEGSAGGDARRVDRAAGQVASHWAQAGDDARVYRWSRLAAAAASRALALEQAADQLATAAAALERLGGADAELAEVLVELATAEFHAGRLLPSLEHCERAADLAERAGRPDLLAAAALVVQGLNSPDALTLLDALSTRALTAGQLPPATNARLLALRASLDAELGRMVDADAGSRRALELAEGTGDPLAVLDAVLTRANLLLEPGDVEERVRLGRLAVRTAESVGRPLTAVLGHGWCADAAYQVGNLAAVDEEIAAVERLASRSRLPLARWHLLRMRAGRLALTGSFEPARTASSQAYDLAVQLQDSSASGMSHAFALMLGQLREDPGELLPGWEQMLRQAPSLPLIRVSLANALVLTGRREEAASVYAEVREMPRGELPDALRAAGLLVSIAPLVEAFADAQAAVWVHDHLLPWARTCGGPGTSVVYCEGSLDDRLARMDAVAGRWDGAVGHYRDAASANTRLGARPALVASRLGLAGALLHRAGPGDVEEALPLARSAAAEARRLDMPGPLAAADRLIAALSAAQREQDPLSEREREVADLVAQALSNRQIASRLVLSERTVESHVRSILGKLGFGSRAEIIAWAHRSPR